MTHKILLVVPGYPTQAKPYNNMFVHSRVKAYRDHGLLIEVFSIGKHIENSVYEGIPVIFGTPKTLADHLKTHTYEKILVHFPIRKTLWVLKKHAPLTPKVMWFHGYESVHWTSRVGFFEPKTLHRLLAYIPLNILQRSVLRRFIQKTQAPLHLVFVSNWLRETFIRDVRCDLTKIPSSIIPNAIDSTIFTYTIKDPSLRTKVLSIRPYSSRKYANDLAVEAVLKLSKQPGFEAFSFTFVGQGRLFDPLMAKLRHLDNVTIRKTLLTHQEIKALHQTHGVMLIPTRQHSHGVSMGAATSSGLVPIASDNTAIPEFLDDTCGFLAKDAQAMAQAMKALADDPALFSSKSKASSLRVRIQCDQEVILRQELALILEGLAQASS